VAVRVGERVGHLATDLERVLERQLLLTLQPVAQGLPFDEGHDVEERAVGLAGVEQRKDVRMGELRRDLDLAQEPVRTHRGGQFGAQDLERDVAVVSEIFGEVDRGHPALAQLALDGVAVGKGGD